MIFELRERWTASLPIGFLFYLMIVGSSAVAEDHPVLPRDIPTIAIPIGEADQHLIERKSPTYPPLAKAARVEGMVRLKLLVNSSGVVSQVFEVSGHPLLVHAAEEAAQQYRYRPFEVAGVPTTVLVEGSVSFSLIRVAKAVFRAMTNEPRIRDRSVVRLSVTPSTK